MSDMTPFRVSEQVRREQGLCYFFVSRDRPSTFVKV